MQPIKREGYETLTAAEDAAQRLADFLFYEGAKSACWPHQPNRISSTMRWL